MRPLCRFQYYGVVLVLVALNTGCALSMPQWEAARTLVSGFSQADKLDTQTSVTWLASVGETGAVLSPYEQNGMFFFANTEGDVIAFDGWTVRAVAGFGLASPVSVSGKEGSRYFAVNGRRTVTQCDPWIRQGAVWSQACANGNGEIVLDDRGDIQKITQSIGGRVGIVTLRVAN